VAEPRIWLLEPPRKAGLPDFGAGTSGVVYSPYVLFRSLLTLQTDQGGIRSRILLPSEIDVLIEKVYADAAAPDSLSAAEQDFWVRTCAKHREMTQKEEGEAESRQIKKPRFRGALARVVQEPREEDSPDLHPAHQALTRLTRPTVSIICLVRDERGANRLPHDNSSVPTLAVRKMSEGGFADIGRLILGEVTSAHRGLLNQLREEPHTPREWTDVGLLCRHHLIVFTHGKARVGAYELFLDHFLGLTIALNRGQGEDE
jgi:CRISPR-associated endonuclease/helicase Cas3